MKAGMFFDQNVMEWREIITCVGCPRADSVMYTSYPPKVKCSISGRFHLPSDRCDVPISVRNPTIEIWKAMNNMNNYQKGQKETMLESNTERHKRVCYELNALYDKKNRDYGDSFHESWKDYGITMAAIRLGDKYNRLHNLTSKTGRVQHVADESVRDTLIDLANYAIMTVMELDAESTEPPYTIRNNGDGSWTKEN